jgi:carotenoid cleavage dioxygenase-like enzyme
VTSGQETVWHQEDCYPGEPVFVEKPEAQTEDDGILLSIVLNAVEQTSFY